MTEARKNYQAYIAGFSEAEGSTFLWDGVWRRHGQAVRPAYDRGRVDGRKYHDEFTGTHERYGSYQAAFDAIYPKHFNPEATSYVPVDGDSAECRNCGDDIAFDGEYGDWFHTGRGLSPFDLVCHGQQLGDPVSHAEPESTQFQCDTCGGTFDYGIERGICNDCING